MITMANMVYDDDPRIREKSKEVELPLSDEDRKTILEMHEFVVNSQNEELSEKYDLRPAIGIAAIQIGIPKKMTAIYIPEYDEDGNIVKENSWALVNPKIVSYTPKQSYLKSGEGCLSVPEDVHGHVPRYAKVRVQGYDVLTDQEVLITARGYVSICLQHELDHFDGILYYDKIDKENPDAPIPDAIEI